MTTLIVTKSFEDNAGHPDLGKVVMRQKGEHIADTDQQRKLWHSRFQLWLEQHGYVRAEGAADAPAPAEMIRPSWMYGP